MDSLIRDVRDPDALMKRALVAQPSSIEGLVAAYLVEGAQISASADPASDPVLWSGGWTSTKVRVMDTGLRIVRAMPEPRRAEGLRRLALLGGTELRSVAEAEAFVRDLTEPLEERRIELP
jgi:hypothetical protein